MAEASYVAQVEGKTRQVVEVAAAAELVSEAPTSQGTAKSHHPGI